MRVSSTDVRPAQRPRAGAILRAALLCCAVAGGPLTDATPAAAQTWETTPEVDYRDPGDLAFGGAALDAVAVGDGGVLYIAVNLNRGIAAFDPEGRLLRTFGREGDGPGEFRRITALGTSIDGAVWAFDSRLRRLSLFSPSGVYLESHRVPQAHRAALVSEGRRIATVVEYPWAGPPTLAPPRRVSDTDRTLMVELRSLDGAEIDTVLVVEAPGVRFRVELRDGRRMTHVQPWGEIPVFGFFPRAGGAFVATARDSGRSEVARVGTGDRDRDDLTVQLPTRRVENRDVELWAETFAERVERFPVPVDAVKDALARPPFFPGAPRAVGTPGGGFWMQLPGAVDRSLWAYVAPNGTLRGRIRIPAWSEILAGNETHIWVKRFDEFDVPFVTRYRVRAQ